MAVRSLAGASAATPASGTSGGSTGAAAAVLGGLVGGETRREGARGVEALGARPLAVGALRVARGDVVRDRVPEHVRRCGLGRHVLREAPDDDRELGLVRDLLREVGQDDRVVRADDRRVRLEEQQRARRDVVAHLLRVVRVVAAHGDHLGARDHRREGPDAVAPLDALARRPAGHLAGAHARRLRPLPERDVRHRGGGLRVPCGGRRTEGRGGPGGGCR